MYNRLDAYILLLELASKKKTICLYFTGRGTYNLEGELIYYFGFSRGFNRVNKNKVLGTIKYEERMPYV